MDGAVIMNLILGIAEPVVLAVCLFYFFSQIKREVYRKVIFYRAAFIGYIAGFIAVIMIGAGNNIVIFFYQLAASCLIGYYLYNQSRIQIFYTICYLISIFMMQGLVVYLLIMWLQTAMNMLDYTAINLSIVVKAVLVVLITKLWTLFVNRSRIGLLSTLGYLSLFIPLCISISLFFAVTYMAAIFMQLYGAGLVVLILLLIILLNVYFIYLISNLAKSSRLQYELVLLKTQNELQFQYYDTLERKYQDSRKLAHDMRNHLHTLKQLYQEGNWTAADAYDGELQKKLDKLGQMKYSDNRILDILLSEKLEQAKEQGINVNIRIKNLPLTGIKNTDITAIFANLLDNALEACGDHIEGSFICIKAGRFHDFLIVDIQNSISEVPSVKKDTTHKGLGLLNVKLALEAYHGSLITRQSDGIFHASVNIPLST